MVNYIPGAIEGIRRFIWSKLQADLEWTKINGLDPIMESQDEPEIQKDQPYIVYNWSFDDQGIMTELSKEGAVFRVVGSNQGQVRQTVQYLVDLLKRWEWTADEINTFLAEQLAASYIPLKQYDYKEVHVIAATGPDYAEQEGGRHEGTVMIKYKYTHPIDYSLDENGHFSRLGMREEWE